MIKSNIKIMSYIGLFFVVFVWGAVPLFTLQLYKFYSPTVRVCFSELVLVAAYLFLSRKHLKEFDLSYLKIGIPTGIFMTLANICQKIGLLYTTPAKYAFLENLSCITVPVIMFILARKKPKFTTILGCVVCLFSTFVLNGASFSGTAFGVGEILCGVAGLLYGFNIALTGIYAKKLNTALYLATQAVTSFFVSLLFSILFNFISIPTQAGAKIIEPIVFSFKPSHMLFVILLALISSALCWTIRTNAMKHIDASIVAVIMPFSAAVTGILSVLSGTDTFSLNLVLGILLGLFAIFLSSFDDIFKRSAQTENSFSKMRKYFFKKYLLITRGVRFRYYRHRRSLRKKILIH